MEFITILWGEEAESFTRSVVELLSDARAEALGDASHASTLRYVLTNQSVRVLRCATHPGVVGGGEVESRYGCCFDRLVAVELGAVIGGDGVSGASSAFDQADGPAVGSLDGTGLELSDHDVAALAIDEGEDAVLVGDVTDHGIGFEVADPASVLCTSGSLRKGPFAGQPTAGIVGTVPFSALFGRTAQMLVEAATLLSITPDMAVDRLVADREPPLTS